MVIAIVITVHMHTQGERRVYDLQGVTSMRQGRLLPPPFFDPYNWCKSPAAAARLAGGGGRASRSCDRDQRHPGHSLVPRPWERSYSGYEKAQARAFTQARSLCRSTHPQLPRACGRELFLVHAALKHTNERCCITALFSKKSKPYKTQWREDDNVALLWL